MSFRPLRFEPDGWPELIRPVEAAASAQVQSGAEGFALPDERGFLRRAAG